MSKISLSVLCGLIFGGIDVALMIPMSFPRTGQGELANRLLLPLAAPMLGRFCHGSTNCLETVAFVVAQ
jgi:hypothetical protein